MLTKDQLTISFYIVHTLYLDQPSSACSISYHPQTIQQTMAQPTRSPSSSALYNSSSPPLASPPFDSLDLAALRSALQPYLPAHPYPSHLRLTYQRPPPPPPLPPPPAPDPAFKYTIHVTPSNQFAPYIPRPPPKINAWGNFRLPMEIFEMVVEVMVRDRQMRSLIKLMRTNSAVYLMAVKVMFRHEEQLDGAGLAKYLGEAMRLETLGVDAFFGSMRQRCELCYTEPARDAINGGYVMR